MKLVMAHEGIRPLESRIILGAAVIEDILATLLIEIVTSLQNGGVNLTSLTFVLVQASASWPSLRWWALDSRRNNPLCSMSRLIPCRR